MSALIFAKKNVNKSAPAIASLNIQTSCWGRAIPMVYGQTRVAPNMIWYGDFTSIPHTTTTHGGKGGGGSQSSTTYTYKAAVILALAQGPINGIGQAWAQKEAATLTSLNMTAALGTAGQAAPAFMTSSHPTEALGYSLLGYVYTSAYDLGDNASLPQHTFEVNGLLYATAGPVGITDAAPDQVLSDILIDARRGAGFTSGLLGSLTQMAAYCRALGIWISPAYTDQATASEMVSTILKITNTAAVFSDGQLKIIPYGDAAITANGVTYTPVTTLQYALTDDDFIGDGSSDPVVITRSPPADAFNHIQVKFRDRTKQYNDNMAEAKADAEIALYGLRPASQVTFDEICDPACARAVAQLLLQRSLCYRNTYKFTLGITYCRLEPMDLVTLAEQTGTHGNLITVRITSVEENDDNTYTFEAEDYYGTAGSTPVYTYEVGGGYTVDYNVSPGSVSTPFIFDAPGRLTPLGYEIWIAAAGVNPAWGGATVWVSSDGTTYKVAGTLDGPARYGTITGAMSVAADPDTTSSIPVDLSPSLGALTTATQSDADLLNTLCVVDAGATAELISYKTATLTSANHYTLSAYTRRGVYGTTIQAHSNGAKFARVDASLFKMPYDPLMVGTTLFFKFTSVNSYGAGEQGLAGVTAYSYNIQGPIGAPADVTGVNVFVTSDGLGITWNAVTQQNLMHYELRSGASWAAGTYIGKTLTTTFRMGPGTVGTTTIWVKALDKQGRYSINAGSDSQSILAPTAPAVTAQIVDNNVLISWTASVSTQPILTYEVRKGAVYSSAAVIGSKAGLFTSVFEILAGTYTYWITGIDIAGNYGTPASFTASVNGPPDYVLKSLFNSTFTGTFSNSKLYNGVVTMPIDIAATYQAHFTTPAWAGPSAQVAASFPIFIEKALSTGFYEEVFDCGSSTAAGQISVVVNPTTIGSPGVTCQISTSPDNVSYTALSAGFTGFGNSFRYVKVRITATSSAGADLYSIGSLSVRVEAKLKTDAGTISAVSTDSGGTVTTFNIAFQSVVSITANPQSTTAAIVVTDFAGGLNPTTFKILAFDTTGTRITKTVNWTVRGY
jgi:hypothetical protein